MIISNELYEATLNNSDVQKMMAKAVKPYSSFIPSDDIHSIKLTAVWNSLRKFDEGKVKVKGVGIQHHIFNTVRYGCLDWIKANKKKSKIKFVQLNDTPLDYLIEDEEVATFDDGEFAKIIAPLSDNEKRIIELRFKESMNYREIAKQLSLSIYQVHTTVKNSLNKLKEVYS